MIKKRFLFFSFLAAIIIGISFLFMNFSRQAKICPLGTTCISDAPDEGGVSELLPRRILLVVAIYPPVLQRCIQRILEENAEYPPQIKLRIRRHTTGDTHVFYYKVVANVKRAVRC